MIIEDTDCCNVWPKIAKRFSWMTFEDDFTMATMPHIESDEKYFVNFCPSCGANARNRKMKTKRTYESSASEEE